MDIKKGTKLNIKHTRKGKFIGRAYKDFNTDDKWYPVVVCSDIVEGVSEDWEQGEKMLCKANFCEIEVIKE